MLGKKNPNASFLELTWGKGSVALAYPEVAHLPCTTKDSTMELGAHGSEVQHHCKQHSQ